MGDNVWERQKRKKAEWVRKSSDKDTDLTPMKGKKGGRRVGQ